jgi:hypothetical protein
MNTKGEGMSGEGSFVWFVWFVVKISYASHGLASERGSPYLAVHASFHRARWGRRHVRRL